VVSTRSDQRSRVSASAYSRRCCAAVGSITQPDADLQHPQSVRLGKTGEGRDVRLQFIALIRRRAVGRLILAGQVQLLTAGRPVPELAHLPDTKGHLFYPGMRDIRAGGVGRDLLGTRHQHQIQIQIQIFHGDRTE
jgi:hypothetical protein